MTRRDIIIIAVLVNAGLLAILFMMAMTSDENQTESVALVQEVQTLPILEEPSEIKFNASLPTDEVDQAIQALSDPAQIIPIEDDNALDDEDPAPQITVAQPVEIEVKETPKKTIEAKEFVEVTVKKGDSLDKIARANGTTVKAIKEANQLKSDRLSIGKVLLVPKSEKKTTTTKSKTKENKIADSGEEYYTLKSGDNPWKIAKKFHIKVDDFLKLNNLDEDKARNLKVGDKVKVKG